MKNQNIIIIAQQNWEAAIGTNPRNMAKEFAKHNRVLYVNMPLDANTILRKRTEPDVQKRIRVVLGQEEGLSQAETNLWVYTTGVILLSANWLKIRSLFRAINHINAMWLAYSIRKAASAVGFETFYILEDGLIFPCLELKRLLKPLKFIYNIRDYVMLVPYFKQHGPWMEAALMKESDIVAANSAYLRDYAQQYNSRSYNIGQGCVLDMYQAEMEHVLPADLYAIPRPVIIYTGQLTALRLDLDLLLAIAHQRPQWNVVLIGPEDEAFARSSLHQLPNVHFIGPKPPHELAAYLEHSQVCINPQLVNDITIGNYPLKIDEYLAMGKPVVATVTSAMDMFADHVYLATGIEQWLQQLEAALNDHSPERRQSRIAFAQSHTWEACVGAIYDVVAEMEQ